MYGFNGKVKTVIITNKREIFPATGDVEIICPVKEAKFLAEITNPKSITLSINNNDNNPNVTDLKYKIYND